MIAEIAKQMAAIDIAAIEKAAQAIEKRTGFPAVRAQAELLITLAQVLRSLGEPAGRTAIQQTSPTIGAEARRKSYGT
jgi:hypothetical protein